MGGGGYATELYQKGDLVECWNCEIIFDGAVMHACNCCGNPFCCECMKEHTQP